MSGHDATVRTLHKLIEAQDGAALSTDDVLVLALPLFKQVAALHAQGRVAALDPSSLRPTRLPAPLRAAFALHR